MHVLDDHGIAAGKAGMLFVAILVGIGNIVVIRFVCLFHGVGVAVFQGGITVRAIRVDIRPAVIRREGDALRRPRLVLSAVLIASDFNRNGLMVDIFLLLTVCILPHLADGDLLGSIFNVHLFRLVGCNEGDLRFWNAGFLYNVGDRWVLLCLVCIQHQEIVVGAVADVAAGGCGLFEPVEHASVNLYNICIHTLRVPEQDLAVCIRRAVSLDLTPTGAAPLGQFERCTLQGVIVLVPFHLEQLQGVGVFL